MKTTFFYRLFDPREPEITRYVGKADKPATRFNSHVKEATSEKSKHLPKSLWINSLLSAGVKPEFTIIDELDYVYASEWCDKETYFIAKYLSEGNPLENASPGGIHPFSHDFVSERNAILLENNNDYNKFKLDEAIMYNNSNSGTFEAAWCLRRDFWANRDDVCSRYLLEIARVDWLKTKLKVLGATYCNFCGTSINSTSWDKIKPQFADFMDILETYDFKHVLDEYIGSLPLAEEDKITPIEMSEYGHGIANSNDFNRMLIDGLHMKIYTGDRLHKLQNGSVAVCNCNKTDKIFLYIKSSVRKIKSFDVTLIFNSDLEKYRTENNIQIL